MQSLFAALSLLCRRGMTLLTVEQNVPLALAHADRAYVLSGGSIVLEGPSRALLDDPQLPEHFLG